MGTRSSAHQDVIGGSFALDRMSDADDLNRMSILQRWLSLDQGHLRSFVIDHPVQLDDLLPVTAVIRRRAEHDGMCSVLADDGDATIRVLVRSAETRIEVVAPDAAGAECVARALEHRAESSRPRSDDETPVRLWNLARFSMTTTKRIDTPSWSSIERNYPSAVRGQLGQLMGLAPPVDGGRLLLWHGPPGTGKTTALRSLIREWCPWAVTEYLTDAEAFFGKPGYLLDVIGRGWKGGPGDPIDDNRWRLVIAEDSDEYLRSNAREKSGAALGRLLNLTDGILGQGQRVLILITTNEDIGRLHPAITRPGRCLARLAFDRFSPAEANEWLDGTASAGPEPETLAELLQRRGDLKVLGTGTERLETGVYL